MTTITNVNAERDRRIALGFDYEFSDERGIHRIITTDDAGRWNAATRFAQAAIGLGHPNVPIEIQTEVSRITVRAQEWQRIQFAEGKHQAAIYTAALDLAAMDPIPADFADDQWWP